LESFREPAKKTRVAEVVSTKKRVGYCRNKARQVLRAFEKERGEVKPPVPVIEIAEWSGFRVEMLETLDDEHSALLLVEFKMIGVNKLQHVHRQRFSVGHELGHHYLNHPPESECEEEEIECFNKEADEFSAELLIPLHLLNETLKHTTDIIQLSHIFLVSPSAMAIKISSQRKLFSLQS